DQRKPAQVTIEVEMSLADSIPSATRAYELPIVPTPILTIISDRFIPIARNPSRNGFSVLATTYSHPGLPAGASASWIRPNQSQGNRAALLGFRSRKADWLDIGG